MHDGSSSQSPLLREGQAAKYLSVEVATLRRWRWSGDGPGFVKIGSAVRYDPADIQKFVEAGRRSSTTDQGMEARVR